MDQKPDRDLQKPNLDLQKPNLDVLRSVAVLMVVVAHLLVSLKIPGNTVASFENCGLFGVYLFFVHTSLVLMWSFERRPNTLDFYIRRAFRIYPLAVAAILFAAGTHLLLKGVDAPFYVLAHVTLKRLVLNCLLLSEIVGHQPILYGVTWSLPSEVYMYLLLPCLCVYARTVRSIWPILVLWLLMVLIDIRFFGVRVGNNFPILIPNFISGVIAYVGFMHRRERLPAWLLLPLIGMMLVVFVLLLPFRADWLLCLLLALLLPSIRQTQSRVLAKVTHTIATYSYGVYLFHPFTIVLGMYVLAGRPLALQLAVVILPLIGIVYATYHLIEAPMIRFGARVATKLAGENARAGAALPSGLEPAP